MKGREQKILRIKGMNNINKDCMTVIVCIGREGTNVILVAIIELVIATIAWENRQILDTIFTYIELNGVTDKLMPNTRKHIPAITKYLMIKLEKNILHRTNVNLRISMQPTQQMEEGVLFILNGPHSSSKIFVVEILLL